MFKFHLFPTQNFVLVPHYISAKVSLQVIFFNTILQNISVNAIFFTLFFDTFFALLLLITLFG